MRKIPFLIVVLVLLTSCGVGLQPHDGEPADSVYYQQNASGDSTLYGLACDGTTDSLLVLLPYTGENPDTFDIVDAFRAHRVYGLPHTGDELAVIINPDDSMEAVKVINIETLKGDWCYEVMPTLRNIDQMPQRMQQRMMERMPDSVRRKLMVPREYGIKLKRGNQAQTIGGGRRHGMADEMSPVEYPRPKRYSEWHLYNGMLILTSGTDSIPGMQQQPSKVEHDTVEIVRLRRDTLVLRFPDHEQSFYRKVEEPVKL